jgi:hypothetical protein
MPDTAWGVEVNEARVYATTSGGAWWFAFRQHYDPIGRIVDGPMTPVGSRTWVLCEDRADADSLAMLMAAAGIHASALRVREQPIGAAQQALLARISALTEGER